MSTFDIAIIGSGPAGQSAAVTAAKRGADVVLIEREPSAGGACVQYGTIPSKTLRETAVTLTAFRRRSGRVYDIRQSNDLQIRSLMTRLHEVVATHQRTVASLLENAGIAHVHGRARFVGPGQLEILNRNGQTQAIGAAKVIVATGSRPRDPENIPIDHENILDSDSLLSMTYLPESLLVVGSGVVASEYAATFACLGTRVTMVDKYAAPLGFLDGELVGVFREEFERHGGRFVGNHEIESICWDGVSKVEAKLDDGTTLRCDKAFIAQGRVANTEGLGLDHTGATLSSRGLIEVNDSFQTADSRIYAVGDSIGPPALAATSVEQGRLAALHALGCDVPLKQPIIPTGIYTIPEIASVGLTQAEAQQQFEQVLVGRSRLDQLARGQIMASTGGLLKIVVDGATNSLLGIHIVGEGATELIHVGQMALQAGMSALDLASCTFNFPTLAEAYRHAAMEVLDQCERQAHAVGVAGDNEDWV